jgi:two-component system, oxyanion-binding sensor
MSSSAPAPSASDFEVHAGFIPLTDCAPLMMVRELGLDKAEGFTLHLHREVSWANIRDKVDVGLFDCAHMLAPLPLAAKLGIGRSTQEVIVPVALNLNGNTITVSTALFSEMQQADGAATAVGGMQAAKALAKVIKQRAASGLHPLSFGIVFPFSCHNYDLRAWLASAGIDPDNDVNLAVIPPPLISESLKAGRVDGFCAGEPWGSVAVDNGSGVIVATKTELWRNSPEKVLGVRAQWADRQPELLEALVRSIIRAAKWLDEPGNRVAAAKLLSEPRYIGVSQAQLERGLAEDAISFHRHGATVPKQAHAIWILTQMIRWGQTLEPFDIAGVAQAVYRTDYYSRAAASLGDDYDTKIPNLAPEEPAAFFGGEDFDPRAPLAYLSKGAIRAAGLDLERFMTKSD